MTLRAVVADDDEDFLDLVVEALAHRGIDVERATTGAELLEKLAELGPFDVVVTDVSMPWMSGFQVAASAREAGLDVPFVLMTGASSSRTASDMLVLGQQAILLTKPFTDEQLFGAVAQLVHSFPSAVAPHHA